jgi:hypothetical protein
MAVIAISPGFAFQTELARAPDKTGSIPPLRGTVAVLDTNAKRLLVSWLPTEMSIEEFERLMIKGINMSLSPPPPGPPKGVTFVPPPEAPKS